MYVYVSICMYIYVYMCVYVYLAQAKNLDAVQKKAFVDCCPQQVFAINKDLVRIVSFIVLLTTYSIISIIRLKLLQSQSVISAANVLGLVFNNLSVLHMTIL